MAGVEPRFDHLLRLSDHQGTFEQASGAAPRRDTGYRTADMAAVLAVVSREPGAGDAVHGLARLAVRFLNEAQAYSGGCRSRLDTSGRWTDGYALQDCWGRCLWALGIAAAHSDIGLVRRLSVVQFERAARGRSTEPRAMAFAAVGAAELLSVEPGHVAARTLIADYVAGLPAPTGDVGWPWPQPRLTHTNAVIAEAMIAAGVATDDPVLGERGLDLLGWLIDVETTGGHLSPTPAAGWSTGEPRPGFDQRPIEVSALAEACARAATSDARPLWPDTVRAAAAWFQGDNDAKRPLWDPETGGCHDGLDADGVSVNQGAESTLAAISTFQQLRRFTEVPL
ncbi:MAG: glycosyltransferase [Mycolicibacterium cosmeticum]|nr:glycosyltransferase [Mycolicibacterium cosmeticum]